MNLVMNKERFSDMENAFTRLKGNDSDASALGVLSSSLSKITGKAITVNTVSPQNQSQECFVMSVYPEESVLDKLVTAILSEEKDSVIAKIWNDTTKWIIEIDTRILKDKVNLTEKELTALILHEVGHIIYSNSVPMKIAKIARLEIAKTNLVNKQLLKDTFFSKLLYVPLLNLCNSTRHKDSMKTEMKADKYAMQSGYGKDLASGINKIIVYAGSETTPDEELSQLMGFSLDTLQSLQKRQNNIVRKNFATMISATPSRFAKGVLNNIHTSLSGSNDPRATVTEAVKDEFISNKIMKITDEFYTSEAFFNRVHKMKRIDPAELDYIALELNNIKSNDDKMMLVSYIYSKLDIIDYYIALIDSKNPKYSVPHSRESLVQMKQRLNDYRIQAINRKLPEVNYGISIQWPTGYEG